jgi:small subunit ribosomal protein S1
LENQNTNYIFTMKSIKRVIKPAPQITPNQKALQKLESFVEELQNPPKTFERGQIVTGTVVSTSSGEMLVDVGGRAEGVVSGREMKLDNEKLDREPGDQVLVYVIKGENDKGQIELSIRRTGTARKWHDLKIAQDEDESVMVKAIEANTGGLIVDIGGGLRGFIPTSQLDSSRIYPSNNNMGSKDDAAQELQNRLAELIGEEIEVKIIEIDREKNRVIFSEKLVTSETDLEQREETLATSKTGDVLAAEVTGIAPFGLFVNAQGLEGLVHLSEISWDKVSNPADFYKVGDKVDVQIIGIQDEGKRVAYSIKRLKKDPWDELVEDLTVGQIVDGVITKVVEYGAFVRIGDKLNGLVHISELSDKLVRDPADIVTEGEDVQLKIISISKEDRHLGLSLKKAQQIGTDEEPEESDDNISPEMASLKEILGDNN